MTLDDRRIDEAVRAVLQQWDFPWLRRAGTTVSTTTDRHDPRLSHGPDTVPTPQSDVYLVLSDAERANGFIRPVRETYLHIACGSTTTMGRTIAETYARDPWFYGSTYCCTCRMHRPVGETGEFEWLDGSKVGT